MKKLGIAALAFGALAAVAPAPAVADHVTYEGGCGFDSNNDPTGEVSNPNTYTGVIYSATVITNPPGAEATVTCTLLVNSGVADTAGPFTGTGVVVGAEDTSFVARDGDIVELCETVTVGGHSVTNCGEAITITIPPQEFWDLFDPPFCDALATLFPNGFVHDPIEILPPDPKGSDIYIDGELFFDCPPYEPPV